MNGDIIFTALAISNKKNTSVNISSRKRYVDTYFKNAVVCLASAKANNPDSDVALVTNVDIPSEYLNLLTAHNILHFTIPFDSFVFDDSYKWGLAFYKLCALQKILTFGYKRICMVDTDTYFASSIQDLFCEASNYILIYYLNRRLIAPGRQEFEKEALNFGINSENTLDIGGEIIAGNNEMLSNFVKKCVTIYESMVRKGFKTSFGDEFILRIASHSFLSSIKPANSYIFRYWTGSFQLVSTNYLFNKIAIYHVPQEKEFGMLKMYKYFYKHNHFPSNSKAIKLLHLKHRRPILFIKYSLLKLAKKLDERFYWD